jgi:hypothetical protein
MKVTTFSSSLIVFAAFITFLIVPDGQAFAQSSISASSSQN